MIFSRSTLSQSFALFILVIASILALPLPVLAISTPNTPKITLTYGDQTKTLSPETIQRSWYTLQMKTELQNTYSQEIEKSNWCPIWKTFLCNLVLTRTDQRHLRIVPQLTPDQSAIKATLDELASTISLPAVEPKFTLQDGKVTEFASGQTGRELDVSASLATVQQALSQHSEGSSVTIPLTIKTLEPSSEGIDSNALGIKELLGEGRTNFSGSPKNRIHNFTLAAQQFNGLIIKPDEEFSFVEHLGEVDGEHGYLPELVIKHNETTPEFGGGICQVSSTAFRAALNSGLKITMRRNHAYAVQYYKPYGMDATVYIPKPDLRFVNNTPASILIQTAVEGQDLVFRFYGTSDGRKTTIDGPHILERSGGGAMKTVFTQKVTRETGETLIEDQFYSNYKSPSLFPHPGQEPVYTSKPADWSQKQWEEYKKTRT